MVDTTLPDHTPDPELPVNVGRSFVYPDSVHTGEMSENEMRDELGVLLHSSLHIFEQASNDLTSAGHGGLFLLRQAADLCTRLEVQSIRAAGKTKRSRKDKR